jgi:SAM-dependent methyltransferase
MSSEPGAPWSTRIVNFMWDKAQHAHEHRWLGGNGRSGFDLLRGTWTEVPLDSQWGARWADLARLDDRSLHTIWEQALLEQSTGQQWSTRGWYYALYRPQFRGKRILDFGSGLGFDAITFAEAGAHVTCADVTEENLSVVCKIARIRGLPDIPAVVVRDFDFAASLQTFDVIWCGGSMINSPFEFTRRECAALLPHLPVGGRWIELGYPEARWLREGQMPFELWGTKTDGGAPWMEWKDLAKLRRLLEPAQFEVILDLNFHNDDFNWFDLVRIA